MVKWLFTFFAHFFPIGLFVIYLLICRSPRIFDTKPFIVAI